MKNAIHFPGAGRHAILASGFGLQIQNIFDVESYADE